MKLILPLAASTGSATDLLLVGLVIVSLAVLALVFGLMLLFIIRYRHDSPIERGAIAEKSFLFEISWTIVTLAAFFGLFIWGSFIYVRILQPPSNALKIYVVGKQWMWKVQHPGGQREINALHVPIDTAVELVMTSEDVIHDFFVPAFRVKRDVLPGQYETMWFRADRLGTYHLFCSQFCGTAHSNMVGDVVVMSAKDYGNWLTSNSAGDTLADQGKSLFVRYGCAGCHLGSGTIRAPSLAGLYGSPVPLADGTTVIADDRYIRDSIMYPKQQVVASFEPVMPSFANVIGEDDLVRIVAYIHSLAAEGHG
jgi:cytochrome c oxidase subunit II